MKTLEIKTAIKIHHTASVDVPWDSSTNIANLKSGEPKEYYEKMFAYRNPEKDETVKNAYKLPHHMVSDKGVPGASNINGCIAGIAALNGARGGVDVPENERAAIYKHLATHLQDAGIRPPALKTYEPSNDEGTVERVYYSTLFGDRYKKGASVFVRGFASVNSEDRDGDFIDPALFEVDTFMKNPQLWFNHDLWTDSNGNRGSIGKVLEAVPVKVSIDEEKTKLTLLHLTGDKKGEVYRDDLNPEDFAVLDKMEGLFVVCEVTEPAVQDQIMDGRLNAFSWQGIMRRSKTGAVSGIDLMEVSIVILPANQRATFMIGKTYTTVSVKGDTTIIDLTAIESLVGTAKTVPMPDELTELERALVDQQNNPPEAQEEPEEGGEEEMTEEHLNTILESLKGVTESITGLTERITAIEEKAVEPAPEPKVEDPPADGEVNTEGEVKATEPETPPANKPAETPAVPDEVIEKITSAITAVADEVKAISQRVEAIEKKPASSKVPSDVEASLDEVKKALHGLAPETRAKLEGRALEKLIIPDAVVR